MQIKPRRSVLYMPGSNERALQKAKTLAADCYIFDLEDAVAPDAKQLARQQVCQAVKAGGYGERELIIRINSLDSEWGRDDLAAAMAVKPDAILVPKVSSAADLEAFKAVDCEIWAMMETPLAMLNAAEIAASPIVQTFVMGTNDLARETGASLENGRRAMVPWLMNCVAAARAFGLDIIDGVYNDFRHEPGLADECEQGVEFGMTGKTLIHPDQIGPCNEAFSPSESEVERAREIIAAFELPENRGKGAISLNGRMVELLHCEMAEKTVALAEAIAQRQG